MSTVAFEICGATTNASTFALLALTADPPVLTDAGPSTLLAFTAFPAVLADA